MEDGKNHYQSCLLTPISVFFALSRSRILAIVYIEGHKPLNSPFIHFLKGNENAKNNS